MIDGDTIVVDDAERIRLIGIDTPEVYDGVECYGPEASDFTADRLAGKQRTAVVRCRARGSVGRTLAYVWLDEDHLSTRDARGAWFATVTIYEPNDRHEQRLLDAEDRARDATRGLWGACR